MFNLTNSEITKLYHRCHGPKSPESVHAWEMRMMDLLGPDDCQFIIRSFSGAVRGLFIMSGHGEAWHFHADPKLAERFSWGEAAVRCSNNRTLEAIRIINQTEAVDSKGKTISLT